MEAGFSGHSPTRMGIHRSYPPGKTIPSADPCLQIGGEEGLSLFGLYRKAHFLREQMSVWAACPWMRGNLARLLLEGLSLSIEAGGLAAACFP